MRTVLLFSTILTCAVGAAKGQTAVGFQNLQRTTGVVGIVAGQTARFNVMYPTIPAPLMQIMCTATLSITDDQGKVLKTKDVSQLLGGRSVWLDLNFDTDLAGSSRTQVHGVSISPAGCSFLATLEVIDNVSQKTVAVVDSSQTWPLSRVSMPTPMTPGR